MLQVEYQKKMDEVQNLNRLEGAIMKVKLSFIVFIS